MVYFNCFSKITFLNGVWEERKAIFRNAIFMLNSKLDRISYHIYIVRDLTQDQPLTGQKLYHWEKQL